MGAALGTGARLTSVPRIACSSLRRQAPSAPAQGCHSKSGPPRPVPLKKRGYDVTRNPHLNKVMVRVGRWIPWLAGKDAPPPGLGTKPMASFQSPLVLPPGYCSVCFGLFVPLLTWRDVISFTDLNFLSKNNTDPVSIPDGPSELESDFQQILRTIHLTSVN
jgi:hypothetical protein